MNSQLHCISDYPINGKSRKICKIISGTLSAKLSNKLFSKFHEKYAELVYVEKKINENVTSGHYEMRLYKNKKTKKNIKKSKDLYCFVLNPMTMTFYANNVHSSQHPFTFVCSSNGISICFSVHTKYERTGWISVLQQLQWQYQPIIKNKLNNLENNLDDISYSNTTPLSSVNDDENNDNKDIVISEDIVQNNSNGRCTILDLLCNN